MIPIERVYKIEQLLRTRRFVPRSDILDALEISPAQFKRDLSDLRDRLNAPIEWDRDHGGYCFVAPRKTGPVFELPGLWFNASEVHALLTMQQLLKELEPGLLAPHVAPLVTRLKALTREPGLAGRGNRKAHPRDPHGRARREARALRARRDRGAHAPAPRHDLPRPLQRPDHRARRVAAAPGVRSREPSAAGKA